SRLCIQLIGANPADAEPGIRRAHTAGISVECTPYVPYSAATQLMSEPAILLVVQSADFAAQIPTKLYEYLRTGNPLLVLSGEDSAVWRFASQFERCRRLDF